MPIMQIFQNKQGFFRNVSILTLCNMVVIVINLFINMYLARVLHPEGYGRYGLLMASSNILATISYLGIQQVAIRRISQDQKHSWYHFKISMYARLFGYIVFALPYLAYALFVHPEQTAFVTIVVVNVLTLTIWNGIQNVAFGMQRMEYTGYLNMGATALILFVYYISPNNILTVYYAFAILISISFLKDILYFYKCKWEGLYTYDIKKRVYISDIKQMIKESFPFYILAVFTLFSTDWPVVFLNNHSGPTEVAFYDSANKILKPTAVIVQTIMSALLPNLSKEYVTNKKRFVEKMNTMFKSLIIFGTFLCIGIALFRFELVYIIFGEEYKSTGDVLLTQCWYVVFHAIFALFGNSLAAMKQDKLIMILSMFYAFVSFMIFWPASFHGAIFLSYGVVLMCVVNMSYHYVLFKKKLPGFISYKQALILFFILIVFILASILIGNDINILIRIVICLILCAIIVGKRNYLFEYIRPKV